MEYDPKDNEVINLLKKLKASNGAYPPEMLALRRQGYLKQVAEVSAGAGLAVALRNIARGGKGAAGTSSTAGTIVEALLVVTLIAEAGAVAYFYRDKVAEYFQSITRSPKVEEVASPPAISSPIAEMQSTPSLVITVTVTGTETLTLTPNTPSSTPPTVLAAGTSIPDGGTTGIDAGSASTGIPGSPGSTGSTGSNTGGPSVPTSVASDPNGNGNNGNHYGQTPIPERTKDSGNTSSSTQTSKNKKKP